MARFVFIVPPLAGHVNPTLSIGAGLLQNGHEVGWISLEPGLAQRLPAGGELLLVPPQPGAQQDYTHSISQQNVYGVESIRFLYDNVLLPMNRYLYSGICQLLDSWQPGLVIHDHQLFAGAMAAWQKNIPFVTSVTAPASVKVKDDLPAIHQWEMNRIFDLQQQLGIVHDSPITCSNRLALVYTTQAFFGNTILPAQYQFIGPVTANRPATVPFNWQRLQAMTYPFTVLVTIGTTFDHTYKKAFFTKLCEALGNEAIGVVVVSQPDLLDSWPGNFMVQEKIPQLELLPHVAAVVCHGGQNTVSETLQHGLPLVVVPIAYDQSYVASRVAETGCGLRLNYKRFKPEQLQQAVYEVLTDNRYRLAAEQLQQSFAAAGGIPRAVQLLEDCLATRKQRIA